MLNLYVNPYSTFATKVLYFVEETGKPYQTHVIDLAKQEQAKPEFRNLNFAGKVPALELDGFGMGESSAIIRYLAQKWSLDAWYPAKLEERARVYQLADYTHQHVSAHLATLAWHCHFAKLFGSPSNPALIDHARSLLLVSLPKLDAWLQGRNYLSRAEPTIADVMLLPFVAMHAEAQVGLGDFGNLKAWYTRMAARPAWIRTQHILASQRAR